MTAVPGVPTNLSNGPTTAIVSWAAPASDGSSPITGYRVDAYGDHHCSTTGALTCTLTNLKLREQWPFYRYGVRVRALNAHGAGTPSQIVFVAMFPFYCFTHPNPVCRTLSPAHLDEAFTSIRSKRRTAAEPPRRFRRVSSKECARTAIRTVVSSSLSEPVAFLPPMLGAGA